MIKNKDELTRSSTAREHVLDIIEAGIMGVDARRVIRENVRLEEGVLRVKGERFNLDVFDRIIVVGGGKAASPMVHELEEILGGWIDQGIVTDTYESAVSGEKVLVVGAGHPIPTNDGAEAVGEMLELLTKAGRRDLVLVLISGGGSALMPAPADISLDDKKRVTDLLLRSGADIEEINAVRKHISAIKGGQLARLAYPANVVSLIFSDVIGDPLDAIASGPTVPDHTSFVDAVDVLKRYELWDRVPGSVQARLTSGMRGDIDETPKPDDPLFKNVHNILLVNNLAALTAAGKRARELGYEVLILSSMIEGESREVGLAHMGIAREVQISGHPLKPPAVILSGGETTVTIVGRGMGGRSQEFVLGALEKIEPRIIVASVDTDGIDGASDAAGAIADTGTVRRAYDAGLSIEESLANNDSNAFFDATGDLIVTGPTGTNVSDLRVLLLHNRKV